MSESNSNSVAGAVESIATRVIRSLPAQFLLLVLINVIFMTAVLWFIEKQTESRESIVAPIIAGCLKQVPLDAMKEMLDQMKRQ